VQYQKKLLIPLYAIRPYTQNGASQNGAGGKRNAEHKISKCFQLFFNWTQAAVQRINNCYTLFKHAFITIMLLYNCYLLYLLDCMVHLVHYYAQIKHLVQYDLIHHGLVKLHAEISITACI